MKNKTYNKKKILVVFSAACILIMGLAARLVYLMVFDAEYYQKKRRRSTKGRGRSKRQEARSWTEMGQSLRQIKQSVRFL